MTAVFGQAPITGLVWPKRLWGQHTVWELRRERERLKSILMALCVALERLRTHRHGAEQLTKNALVGPTKHLTDAIKDTGDVLEEVEEEISQCRESAYG